jgi:tRNA A-37 threonylcarbamoyl transferase component Bud32/membrane-associated phospholipid phosphatase
VIAAEAAPAPHSPLTRGRRPSGRPAPLPRSLHRTGVAWITASVLLVILTVLMFGDVIPGAIAVTAIDDAVVAWLAGLDAAGVTALSEVLAAPASWVGITIALWALLLALLVTKRLRHLLVTVVAWTLQGFVIQYLVGPIGQRPRPFGVVFRTDWYAWSLPSEQVAALAVTLVGILYGLVPPGRWRQTGKWAAATTLALVALARIHLGVDAPSDVIVGVVIGVTIPLLGFRLFTPNDTFPVAYRRGRAAHLDVGGPRKEAIRRALDEQLGVIVSNVEPFGLTGSAGSTPLRIDVVGHPEGQLFGKLYARTHLRADRWYKLGRELLYGRLEDEKPFHTVRRLVQQEDYAQHKLYLAGLPTPRPYGFVELAPEREYLLVTEFVADATELGEAQVDDRVIDDGLALIRRLRDAGVAHRDIKPANLLVRGGHLVLIDVAFAQARPSRWRQAVDLANMMLCLALRSTPRTVYARAVRQFSIEEITEAFAAARGLALPSQLRRMLRESGRDLHEEFLNLLPARPRPIRIQRWGARRVAILLATVPLVVLLTYCFRTVLVNNDSTTTPLAINALGCDQLRPLLLEAQSVPTASLVPCVQSLAEGWSFGTANARNGWSKFTLDHDRLGKPALTVRLTATCDTTGATPATGAAPGTRRFEQAGPIGSPTIWHTVFPGGCVTSVLRSTPGGDRSIIAEATSAVGFTTRDTLRRALEQESNGRLHLDPGRPD